MWDEWEQGEINQLNQIHNLWIFGEPLDIPNNTILLIPQWKYSIKRNGNRRSRQYCDVSKRAAHMMR